MTTLYLSLLIGLVAFIVVLWPLVRGRFNQAQPQTEESLQSLRHQRDSIYDSLRELDFDLQTGKMSEDDYADLSERYKRRAIGLLKQLDDRQRDVLLALDDEIEREVAVARKSRKTPAAAPAGLACAVCGAKLEVDDLFCRRCGAPVDRKCPGCNAIVKADDRHCARCGRSLA